MHPASQETIEVDRQCGHQGFAFTGFHLGNIPGVEDHAAEQLHIIVPLPEQACRHFTHDGKGFWQQVIERGALGEALAELTCLGPQIVK